jgi:signal peptidase II
MKLYLRLLGTAAFVVALDQLTKNIALSELKDGPIEVTGFLSLHVTYNSGGAFGIFDGAPYVFLGVTVAVLAGILLWARRIETLGWVWPFGLVLGGGLGNIVDRLVREPGGEVVDFIDLHAGRWGWPLFNVADMAIVTGVCLVLLLSSRASGDQKRSADERAGEET